MLANKLLNHTLHLPRPAFLSTIARPMPYVFVGDEAFPLMEHLMRPYPRRSVTNNYEHKVFNYRLSRARQTAECAFGIVASRFRVFRKPFEIKVTSVVSVVKAACVLHNYLRTCCPLHVNADNTTEEMPQSQLLPLHHTSNRSALRAFSVRQHYTDYFNSEGMVPWQRESVLRGKY